VYKRQQSGAGGHTLDVKVRRVGYGCWARSGKKPPTPGGQVQPAEEGFAVPPTISFTPTEGGGKGNEYLGSYELG